MILFQGQQVYAAPVQHWQGGTPWNNVTALGAKGDGVTDDTTKIQSALTAGDTYFPAGTYLVSATLSIPSNRRVMGTPGATIKLANAANRAVIGLASGASNISIEGLVIDGNQANQLACAGACRGIVGITSAPHSKLRIVKNQIINTRNDAMAFSGVTSALVSQNHIADVLGEGSSGAGISFTGPTSNRFITITDNTLERIGGTAIAIGLGKDSLITNNNIYDAAKTVAQQAIVAGYGAPGSNTDAERITIANNVVHTTTLHGCIRVGGTDLVISGNVVTNCANTYAIISSTTNDGVTRGKNIRVLNNTVVQPQNVATNIGIYETNCDGCDISGNHIDMVSGTTANALGVTGSTGGRITNNKVVNGNAGIRLTDVSRMLVADNIISGQVAWGIYTNRVIAGVNDRIIYANNLITNLAVGASGGINATDAGATNISIVGNTVTDAPATGSISGSDGAWASGNFVPGNACNVASAATINPHGSIVACDRIRVTGTTTITSMTAGALNRVVTLTFASALTLTDGGNLLLAGNFVTTADDSITLISDGTNWIEKNRSIN